MEEEAPFTMYTIDNQLVLEFSPGMFTSIPRRVLHKTPPRYKKPPGPRLGAVLINLRFTPSSATSHLIKPKKVHG
jgi:hypothetical protein